MPTDPSLTSIDAGSASQQSVVNVTDLRVDFPGRGWRSKPVTIVDGVTFEVASGSTYGLVGESGSGKSTIARAMLRLIPITSGRIELRGQDLSAMSRAEIRRHRRFAQMVFQDPFSSINPSMVVGDVIAEPLEVHLDLSRQQRDARVVELLDLVGLPVAVRERYVHEFSGGQRQRIAIARALATNPAIVVCDEAVSALDVSTQNQIVGLLDDLSSQLGVAYLFISHGLDIVRHISDTVGVLYLGKLVEEGPADRVYASPAHPYTASLLKASPIPNPRVQKSRRRTAASGEPPDPARRSGGCVFVERCPIAQDICSSTRPEPRPVLGGGQVSCHFPLQPLVSEPVPVQSKEK